MQHELRGLLITGTDTGVGKTYVACRIASALRAAGLRVGAYKPVCSGAAEGRSEFPRWDDVEALWNATGGAFPRERIGPQCFLAPLAPPVAAREEGKRVDASLLQAGLDWWRGQVDVVVIEGAGGWLSPISDDATNADFAAACGCPVVIVAADRLGMINHTLLTVESIQARGLPLAGIVVNRHSLSEDSSIASNAEELARRTSAPILTVVESWGDVLLREGVEAARMGWNGVAGPVLSRQAAGA
jgi:dethiobiotin synthetase